MENNFTVIDAVTVFMLPFSFNDEYYNSLKNNNSIWEMSKLGIDKSAFYPHIYNFLVDNLSDEKRQNPTSNSCIVYSLKDNLENTLVKDNKYITKLFSKIELEIKVKRNETNKDKLHFRLLNEKSKLSSPKLILYPLSSMGILMISVELIKKERKQTLNDLLIFNNMLHKIDQPTEIQITLPENAHGQRIEEANKICQTLAPQKYDFKEHTKVNENNPHSWHFHKLFEFLLFNLEEDKLGIEPFNKSRFHLFTYFHIDSSEKFEGKKQVEEEYKMELMEDIIRIASCQNKKYKVLSNDLKNNEKYMQTFENIYIASSVEGSCMMVDSQDSNNTFFSNFKDGTFLARYLWIYLLVYLQRNMLIKLTKNLMERTSDTGKLVKDLSEVKINSFFTDISDHTQHNIFYQFCSDKLLVKKHLEEIKEKIKDADSIFRYEIEQNQKNRDYHLNLFGVFLTALMVPQVFFALVDFYYKYHKGINCWVELISIILYILIIMMLIIFVAKRNKKHKGINKER